MTQGIIEQDFQYACKLADSNDLCIRAPLTIKNVVLKRRKVAQYLRDKGHTYQAIGKVMHRHHTTVINMLNQQTREKKTHRSKEYWRSLTPEERKELWAERTRKLTS